MYKSETNIVEESIYIKFDDKLNPKNSKLYEKLADLEITFSNSEGVQLEIKQSTSEVVDLSNDVDTPTP